MMVFEQLHAGGKFGDGGYKVSGGLHGVGASVTNALSQWLKVTVRRDGVCWRAEWAQGKRTIELYEDKKDKTPSKTGTTVVWKFDETIFNKSVSYDPSVIERRLRDKSYLVRGVKFTLKLEGQKDRVFQSEEGIAEYVRELASEQEPLHPEVIFFEDQAVKVQTGGGKDTEMGVEIALQWTKKAGEMMYSFANIVTTPDGGAHVTGLKSALTKAMNNFAYETGKLKKEGRKEPERFDSKDIFAALVAAVSVKLEDPQFEGQTKGKLNNSEARSAVQSMTYAAFTEWLESKKNHKTAKEILERCLHARRVRLAQGKVSKNYNPNSIWADTGQSAKLADCQASTPVEERELFVVEGDSAGGTAKEARDPANQAILPLRGKPINALTASNTKVFENKEVQAVISALGARTDELDGEIVVVLPPEARRYSKMVIMADADSDGAHITALICGMMWRLFPEFVKEGRLFIARPPLFKINLDNRGDTFIYAYSEEERAELVKKNKRSGDDVSRFKGLGEMDGSQLEETVMDPKTRQLYQVTLEDLAEVEDTMNLILGASAARRKEWLESGDATRYLEMV
jgi:DNA gyrase subunit B